MSKLSTTTNTMPFHRRRDQSNGLREVRSATTTFFHRLTTGRYLQDLQKQVELHQRSSSVNTNTETPFPSAPPPYRSTSYCSPSGSFSSGIKRSSDSAFGVGSTLSSPALTVEQQQSDSGSRGLYQQQSQSPLSIWPSAFTIPSKIIKNTRKNRRTWSEYPYTLTICVLTG
jgi:hypothetical protein